MTLKTCLLSEILLCGAGGDWVGRYNSKKFFAVCAIVLLTILFNYQTCQRHEYLTFQCLFKGEMKQNWKNNSNFIQVQNTPFICHRSDKQIIPPQIHPIVWVNVTTRRCSNKQTLVVTVIQLSFFLGKLSYILNKIDKLIYTLNCKTNLDI